MILREAFDYEFSRLDPTGDHIDPPSVALYETVLAKGPDWRGHPVLADSWQVSADGLVAERWADYPGAPAPFLEAAAGRVERIEWLSILDEHDRLAALEDGRVECLHGPPLEEVDRLRKDPRFAVVEQPQASNMYL